MVLLVGTDHTLDKEEADRVRVDDYSHKPINSKDLQTKISELLLKAVQDKATGRVPPPPKPPVVLGRSEEAAVKDDHRSENTLKALSNASGSSGAELLSDMVFDGNAPDAAFSRAEGLEDNAGEIDEVKPEPSAAPKASVPVRPPAPALTPRTSRPRYRNFF